MPLHGRLRFPRRSSFLFGRFFLEKLTPWIGSWLAVHGGWAIMLYSMLESNGGPWSSYLEVWYRQCYNESLWISFSILLFARNGFFWGMLEVCAIIGGLGDKSNHRIFRGVGKVFLLNKRQNILLMKWKEINAQVIQTP